MFVKQGNQEWEVSSLQTVKEFKQALAGKQRVMVKRLPEFNWQVQFSPDEPKNIWHLSKDGYITRFPHHGDAIFRINFEIERLLRN